MISDHLRIPTFDQLLEQVHACQRCAAHLPYQPLPIVQLHPQAKILIASQAPGRKAHNSGIPFQDASGERLRQWLGISADDFYDVTKVAILPMGFCYPGKGKTGDLPPRPECAKQWHQPLLQHLPNLELTVLIGQYAQAYHLQAQHESVTQNVANWQKHLPQQIALPHPSPLNGFWLRRNPWFELEVVPVLQQRVQEVLKL